MIDVGGKPGIAPDRRCLRAHRHGTRTLLLIQSGNSKKGALIGIARIAGIQGAKRTSELIPLCHLVALTRVAIDFAIDEKNS